MTSFKAWAISFGQFIVTQIEKHPKTVAVAWPVSVLFFILLARR